MKFVGFNIIKSTIQIKFASDLAEKSIDEYDYHEFNVVELHDNVQIDEILKSLALAGWNIALQQEIAEQTAKNNEKVNLYKSFINQEFTFSEESLFAPPECKVSEKQPLSTGLMVI